jgi:hypothetical protein
MNYNVLLISEQKLKSQSPIDPNVDSEELRYGIQQAQNIFIQETLGTNFYEQILNQVESGDINLSGNTYNKELLNNFIQPTLVAYSYYLILDNQFVKLVNVGLQQFRSEQSQPIGIKEFTYLKDSAKDRAEFLDNLMRRHLVFENWKYPEYTRVTNNGQLIPEFGSAFKTSITLPSGSRFAGSRYGNGYYSGNGLFDCQIPWWYGGRRSGE